ncbi:uncharacterized protein BDZ99DRAFT_465613 [Mytilinidion resinicola]|uniref:C2H2-type domain-containing protein n=1 Tax=Mytilinidion resinicola TaxID=574789 RepID=A0A6A6YDE3_9PEZI|nr:uncharacterized protein BDZ99DRAFT_465613 [Mytilinidion resinicola]KAF2806842.1 hypothetical protein BDZ99DRAFT_465613 [Mytilinidion resinicola]
MDYSRQYGTKVVNVFGTELPLEEQNTQDMSNMQRYFHGTLPFAPEYLHSDLSKHCGGSMQNQYLEHNGPLEPQSPWPTPEEHRRQCSPDDTIWSASSGSWSASPRDELQPSNMFARYSMTSQVGYPAHGMSYPEQQNANASFADQPMGGGSGIALREIQYAPDEEPEQSVEESDLKIEFAYEQETMGHKMEDCDDSGLGESMRDAESVQPVSRDEDGSDSEYKPAVSSPTSKRRRRRTSQSSSCSSTKHTHKRSIGTRVASTAPGISNARVVKKGRSSMSSPASASVNASSNGGNNNAVRPFPCPLAPYSCSSTFASKNEWKRHVSTQHIRLGFWRCDLCPTNVDSANSSIVYYNDFNRKDLFTQHLRRMHAAPVHAVPRNNQREYPVTEDNLPEHQKRCYTHLRSPPPRSSCLFCDRQFLESGGWEERMEHVGRHLEKDRKAGGAPTDIKDWQHDKELEQWLVAEGLIEVDRSGGWKLGDGKPKRGAEEDDDEDEDAQHDDEDEA